MNIYTLAKGLLSLVVYSGAIVLNIKQIGIF